MAKDRLSARTVENARYEGKPRKLFDGGGLYLHVTATGRYWRLKYRFDGREKLLALGVYPDVPLKLAREKRQEARTQLAQGIDPGAQRRAEKEAARHAAASTFEAVAREWWDQVHSRRVVPVHADDNLRRFVLHVFPHIGKRPVGEVTAPELLAVLRRLVHKGSVANAHRVRTLCGQVFRYAIATERADRDPAADLRDSLPAAKPKHHPAVTDPEELAKLLRAIETYDTGEPTTKAALKLQAMLFTRPGELRTARWEAFDLEAGTWDFQPSKGGGAMIVDLPRQALEVLKGLHQLAGSAASGFVFPSVRGPDRPMAEATLRHALLKLGYADRQTAHGFRATARTVLVEHLGWESAVVEMALAHAVRDANGTAYNRVSYRAQRREMLQRWCDYLDELRTTVVPLQRDEATRTAVAS